MLMDNNLKRLQAQREAMLPPDIEPRVTHQVHTFSFFSKVVELFVPNALDTATRMVGGEAIPPSGPGTTDPDAWRRSPRQLY